MRSLQITQTHQVQIRKLGLTDLLLIDDVHLLLATLIYDTKLPQYMNGSYASEL